MKKLFTLFAILSIATFNLNAQEWSEDFEGGELPSGWTIETLASDDGYLFGTDLGSTSFPIPNHTTYAATNDDACNCNKSADNLITPTFQVPADGIHVLSFECYFVDGDYDADETAIIEITNDGGDSWTELANLSGAAGWVAYDLVLSDYAGDSVQVAFKYDDGGGWNYGLAIDDVSVAALPDYALSNDQIVLPEIYTTEDGNMAVSCYFTNNGAMEVTSLTFNYTVDGGDVVSSTISGLSIATFETAMVSSPELYEAMTLGVKNINAWASEVNGQADVNTEELGGDVQFTDQSAVRIGLSETFTSNTCGPCAGFNPPYQIELDDLDANVLGSNYVAVKYQVDWPSPGTDVCYNGDVQDRIDYYGINAVPTTLVEAERNNYDYASPAVSWADAAANVSLQFQDLTNSDHGWVDITADVLWDNASSISIDISVTPKANFDSNSQTLYVAVLNKHYEDDEINPDGTNGETEWDYVVRKMLPSGNGTTMEALTTGETETFSLEYDFTIGDVEQDNYNLVNENVQVVAWVQDNDSRAIRNATLGDMSLGLEEINNVVDFNIYPNPTSDIAKVSMNLIESNTVNVEITDLLGKVVYAESMGTMQAGPQLFDIDATSIGNGMYLFNVYVGGEKVTERITISK
jgi:hypothetical protein